VSRKLAQCKQTEELTGAGLAAVYRSSELKYHASCTDLYNYYQTSRNVIVCCRMWTRYVQGRALKQCTGLQVKLWHCQLKFSHSASPKGRFSKVEIPSIHPLSAPELEEIVDSLMSIHRKLVGMYFVFQVIVQAKRQNTSSLSNVRSFLLQNYAFCH